MARMIITVLFALLPVFAETGFAFGRDLPLYRSQEKIGWQYYKVKKGDTFYKLFKKYALAVERFNRMDAYHLIAGMKIRVPKNLEDAANYEPIPLFAESKKNLPKFIYVNLSEQWFGFYKYGKLEFSGPISSGKENCVDIITHKIRSCETPEGEFQTLMIHRDHVSSKYKEPDGSPAPMTFAVLFLQNGEGYWMHEQALPGWPDSHGCVRMMFQDARMNCNNVYGKCSKSSKKIYLPKKERIDVKIEKLPAF